MRTVTWLGSGWVLIPVLVAATIVLWRHPDRRAVGWLWAAYVGAFALDALATPITDRARPPAADLIEAASGLSYPSGHALATWGILAVVASAGRSPRARARLLAAAAGVVLIVGVSRVYLGAGLFTDVVAGYALGAAWLAFLLALRLRRSADRPHVQPRSTPAG